MDKRNKTKQIVIRVDKQSHDSISEYAKLEHRGIGEFVRHTALDYIEKRKMMNNQTDETSN
jgi:uncharacterized protein (DUF1778 family)